MQNGKFKFQDENRGFDTFKHNLKTLMNSRGYNMKSLSLDLNMNTTSVSRYFIDRNPDTISLWRIADHFDVSIDWLLGRSSSKFDSIPENAQRIASLYLAASDSDKLVIETILKKYAE